MELKIATIDKSALLKDRILPLWRADGQMRDIRKRARRIIRRNRFPGSRGFVTIPGRFCVIAVGILPR
jgi:hypothetical protein